VWITVNTPPATGGIANGTGNVTINGSIAAALNDAGGYVHIRIEYNESQLGTIDENTLYIYKFINGTGWLKMVEDENPDYCIANGRDLIANHVWVNVTNCSTFLLAGTGAATPTPSGGSNTGDGGRSDRSIHLLSFLCSVLCSRDAREYLWLNHPRHS
jgi:hypothetical protein